MAHNNYLEFRDVGARVSAVESKVRKQSKDLKKLSSPQPQFPPVEPGHVNWAERQVIRHAIESADPALLSKANAAIRIAFGQEDVPEDRAQILQDVHRALRMVYLVTRGVSYGKAAEIVMENRSFNGEITETRSGEQRDADLYGIRRMVASALRSL